MGFHDLRRDYASEHRSSEGTVSFSKLRIEPLFFGVQPWLPGGSQVNGVLHSTAYGPPCVLSSSSQTLPRPSNHSSRMLGRCQAFFGIIFWLLMDFQCLLPMPLIVRLLLETEMPHPEGQLFFDKKAPCAGNGFKKENSLNVSCSCCRKTNDHLQLQDLPIAFCKLCQQNLQQGQLSFDKKAPCVGNGFKKKIL